MEKLVFCILLFNPHQLTPSMPSPYKRTVKPVKTDCAD